MAGTSFGGDWYATSGDWLEVRSPTDGAHLASVQQTSTKDFGVAMRQSQKAFEEWREVPAPLRGEIVRQFAEALREKKEALGTLVSLETGKILTEGLGEVQEMIDICDFAVGAEPDVLGAHPAERKTDAPDDGAMASARDDRCDFRLQLPRRGMVLECGVGMDLRGHGNLETV